MLNFRLPTTEIQEQFERTLLIGTVSPEVMLPALGVYAALMRWPRQAQSSKAGA
jgi:hypothetical protein